MVAKTAAKKLAAKTVAKASPKAPAKRAKTPSAAPAKEKSAVKSNANQPVAGWLQDASIEVPVPPTQGFKPGQREVEFSVGMRQQDLPEAVRSEMRGRALVHAEGHVLALVEASYVTITSTEAATVPGLPQGLYAQLRPHLESLLALAGHTPPLPATLEQVG